MNAKSEIEVSKFDYFKWLLVIVLVVVAVVGNHYFSSEPILYRVLGVTALAIVAVFIATRTSKGNSLMLVLKDAQVEIRKVVWPSKQETMQTTMIVVVVVLIVALVLWGMDSLLGWLISLIIG